MTAENIYKQHSVLFVDDEKQAQKYFSKIFGKTFNVLLASDGVEALEVFKQHEEQIGLIVSDQRMPNMTGSQFLTQITQRKPDVVKILSTAYSDLDAAIDAVNEGGIYRYITKPWDISELEITLRRAMEYYNLKIQHKNLANAKLGGIKRAYLLSRLIAIISSTSFINKEPGYILAFRDLLRFGIQEESSAADIENLSEAILDKGKRNEIFSKFQKSNELLVKQLNSASNESIDSLVSKAETFIKNSSLSRNLTNLIAGRLGQSDATQLAILFELYAKGFTLQRANGSYKINQGNVNPSPSTEEALCALFIDESMLISDFIETLH